MCFVCKNEIKMIAALASLLLLLSPVSSAGAAAVPDSVVMTAQADDFIDSMPDGLQDSQADAVTRAIGGDLSSLLAVRNFRNASPQYPECVEVTDLAPDLSAGRPSAMRLYRPAVAAGDGPLPVVVYLHGGGWAFGSLNSCAEFCASVAATGRAIVLAVDYPLVPDHTLADALAASVAGIRYAVAHAAEWGSAPGLVSVAGDSAGGHLALLAAMKYDESGPQQPVNSIIAIYPVATLDVPDRKDAGYRDSSWRRYGRGYGLDSRLMSAFLDAALSTVDSASREGYDPLKRLSTDKSKLPPTLIISAGRDILLDQSYALAETLAASGSEVTHEVYPGAVHLFITVPGQPAARTRAVNSLLNHIAP